MATRLATAAECGVDAGPIASVPGLTLTPDALTSEEEVVLLAALSEERGHAVHQVHVATEFGWRFASAWSGIVTADDYLGPWPAWLGDAWRLCVRRAALPDSAAKTVMPDHALVNVYEPGDGCMAHVDDVGFWTDWVVGLSLGSGCTLQFTSMTDAKQRTSLWVPPRSVYALHGDARYKFMHAIPFVTADNVDGKLVARLRRTSITFRAISPTKLPDALRRRAQPPDKAAHA
jgi:alkylated DNA repair dioxygenase AlkB